MHLIIRWMPFAKSSTVLLAVLLEMNPDGIEKCLFDTSALVATSRKSSTALLETLIPRNVFP
jgi:hypothetical protein